MTILRERGYSVEQANDIVLPHRIEVPVTEPRQEDASSCEPLWVTVLSGIGDLFVSILPWTRP
ncbi:MAG TPA: hypothetical protein VH951_00015 [Dehalococcoidia bacterium]